MENSQIGPDEQFAKHLVILLTACRQLGAQTESVVLFQLGHILKDRNLSAGAKRSEGLSWMAAYELLEGKPLDPSVAEKFVAMVETGAE